jgi:hypothetical protein
LQAQARAKLEEVEARMADLAIVRDPIPFSDLATHSHDTTSTGAGAGRPLEGST